MIINLDSLDPKAHDRINKEGKCQSMRSFNKKPIHNLKNDNYEPQVSKL